MTINGDGGMTMWNIIIHNFWRWRGAMQRTSTAIMRYCVVKMREAQMLHESDLRYDDHRPRAIKPNRKQT